MLIMKMLGRKEFIDYCWKTGFFLTSVEDWNDKKFSVKIKQYFRKGYRIKTYSKYSEYEIINIFGKYNPEIIKNLERLYLDVFNEQPLNYFHYRNEMGDDK